jgi:cell division transport system permease protein
MMLGWLFASPSERRLLGGSSMRGPTPWVIAIMSFSIMIIAASGLVLANTASTLSEAIQARYSVELPNGGGDVEALLKAVQSAPGVSSADAVPEQDMRRTLARWLGPAAQSPELPVPALVNFDVKPGASLAAVQQKVRQAAPEARIVAHRESVGPLLHSLHVLQWVAVGLVLLLSGAAAAAVVLAARGAIDTNRFTIEVMHGIGATDVQVTHLFQRRIAIDALAGSVAGAIAAALVLLLLASGAAFAGELAGGAVLRLPDFLLLLLLPLALTILATFVARAAVLAALREAL